MSRTVWGVLVLLLVACEPTPTLLVVQVRTDLAPGRDFASIVVTEGGRRVSARASDHRDWGLGVRVAELEGLTGATARLTVEAIDPDGAVVVARPVRVELRPGVQSVTVLLTVACGSVECPTAADAPDATACFAGRCVAEDCVVESPDRCGTPACVLDEDCPTASPCTTRSCVGGACFSSPDHASCADGETCDVAAGCVGAGTERLARRGPGHALIHVLWEDGAGEVLRVGVDGGRLENLTALATAELGRAPPIHDASATASPDGRWIAFIDAASGFVRIDVDGVEPTLEIPPEPWYAERQGAAISDDGATLVFVDGVPGGFGLFTLTRRDGSSFEPGAMDLAEGSPLPFNRHPAWRSPTELAFACANDPYEGAGTCSVALAGGAVQTLRDPPDPSNAFVSGPSREPSGDLLIAETPPAEGSTVYRLPAAGGAATPVATVGYLAEPCALPDGRYLVLDGRPPLALRVMRGATMERMIPLEDRLRPGVELGFLTGCSP